MSRPREPKHRWTVDVLGHPAHKNVVFMQRKDCQQYYARWYKPNGRVGSKSFAVSKFGAKDAYDAACQLAKEYEQFAVETERNRVYIDNDDGTTTMNLRYKDTPVVYVVDTTDIPLLQTKTWSVTSEGYAVTTSPSMTYLHRYIRNAGKDEYVHHLNRNIKDCRQINLSLTKDAHFVPQTIGSVNELMSKRGRDRTMQRQALMAELKPACTSCGFPDHRAMHFDHVLRETKAFNISAKSSLTKIKEEMKKCQILCAFCHSLKTCQEITPRDKSIRTKRILFTGIVNKMKREQFKSCEHCSRTVIAGQEQAFHLDHIDPKEKVKDVSALANHGLSLEELLTEVAKTRLLCANCHSIRTYEQFQSGEISDLKRSKLAERLAQNARDEEARKAGIDE